MYQVLSTMYQVSRRLEPRTKRLDLLFYCQETPANQEQHSSRLLFLASCFWKILLLDTDYLILDTLHNNIFHILIIQDKFHVTLTGK
jgi:hypothetical protein